MPSPKPVVAHSRVAQAASGTGWILVALALIVLSSWAFHASALISVVAGLATMKPNAAAAFLLAGLALIRRNDRDLPFYSLGVLVIGAATLIEYLSNSDFGIDQLLFRDPRSAIDPGRMSQITSVGFTLLGSALALMKVQSETGRRISRGLSLVVGALGCIAILGYSYDTQALYQVRPYSSVALHTAIGFLIAAIGVHCANPTEGLVRQIHADSAGGSMLRQLLPAALLIPYLLGFAAWVAHKHLGWEIGFSLALVIAATMLCLVLVMLFNAKRLEREDFALRESKERFRRVVDHIGDAVFVDDVDGHIVFANDRFLNLFGFHREELQHVALEDYVAPEYRPELRDRHDRRMRGEALPTHFEYEGFRRDGTRMWLEVDVVPIKDQAGKPVGTQSAVRDITERKQAQSAVHESEERFRLVANTAPVMIWMAGPNKLCNYFNQPWLEFTGRTLETELGDGWAEGVHPEDFKSCMDTYVKAFDRHESFQMQYRLLRHDGQYRWISDIGVPRLNPDGSFAGYIGSCIDITDHKLAEEVLEDMGQRLIEAHEEERTWIARELHDDINQKIALLAIELGKWDQHLPKSAVDAHDHIRRARHRLSEIGKDIQALSHRLHSSNLEYLGLAAAAGSFCKELSEQHRVEIDFSHTGIPRNVSQEISLCLFRVLQEALQNAVKHSGVRHFRVELSGNSGEIQLTVSDLGVGFGQQDVMKRHGLGLISMRERLKLVNGELSVQSEPGRGTKVNARVPLKAESTVPDLAHCDRTA